MTKQNQIGLIILAAGASNRLGKPKQLLPYRGKTLLRRMAEEALLSRCRPVVVVLGFESERLKAELTGFDVHLAENAGWVEGMAGSIRTGLEKLLEINKRTEAVVLTVCDQPFVTARVIDDLVKAYRETKAPIIASFYEETCGVPALFGRELFPRLAELKGNQGAKPVIKQYSENLKIVSFPEGAIDIDTIGDYERLRRA